MGRRCPEDWKGRDPDSAGVPPCMADPRFPWAVPCGPFADRRQDPVWLLPCIGERPVPNGRAIRFDPSGSMCMVFTRTGRSFERWEKGERERAAGWPRGTREPACGLKFRRGARARRGRRDPSSTHRWPVCGHRAPGLRFRQCHHASSALLVKKCNAKLFSIVPPLAVSFRVKATAASVGRKRSRVRAFPV
jgi:hypothetical protein